MYQELLLDHYRNPRNRGTLLDADFMSREYNPSCGDSVSFQGIIDVHGCVSAIAFEGAGCVISQATASLLSEHVKGMLASQVLGLSKDAIVELIGIELGPTRLKCALLPLEALQQGIAAYLSKVNNA